MHSGLLETAARAVSARRFTVYGLVDPRDGSIRYIGATNNLERRLRSHRCPTDYGQGEARRAWFREVRAGAHGPIGVVLLQEVESSERLVEAEAEWIRRGRQLGWPLTNCLKSQPRTFPLPTPASSGEGARP